MFDNLNWWEIGALLLIALLIFGDRLPNMISDGLRLLRNLRNMAQNATGDLSRELGTEIRLEDLHPKAFIRKHLLSEEDEAAIRKPLQGAYEKLRADLTDVHRDLGEVAAAADIRSATGSHGSTSKAGPTPTPGSGAGPTPPQRRYDIDAT